MIISALAALAFFGMQKVRGMANKTNSIRNLSQFQIANMTYATEHNGRCVPLQVMDDSGKAGKHWFQNVEYLASLTGKQTEELEKDNITTKPLAKPQT